MLADGLVYAASGDLWNCLTDSKIDSSPVVADGTVYIGSNDHRMYALDARTGRLIWRRDVDGEVDSRPAVADETVYIGSDDGKVYAVNASTGL